MPRKANFAVLVLVLFTLISGLLFSIVLPRVYSAQLPLAKDGAYQVGMRTLTLTDVSRDKRSLQAVIWYPALLSQDKSNAYLPDPSGAPYPVIIFSHGYGGTSYDGTDIYINHLVSQGYVVAGVNHEDITDQGLSPHAKALIDRPLDLLFLLDQLTNLKSNDLVGIMDTNNVGLTGISFGAYTIIAAGGARIDPNHFTNWCSSSSHDANFDSCRLLSEWDKLLAYHQTIDSPSQDTLWPAMTDKRIHAILTIAPCFGQLFGEKGLSDLVVPALIIGSTTDEVCWYDIDSAYIYKHIGSSNRYLISFANRQHKALVGHNHEIIQQYASAFFGLYLQGKTNYTQYLTADSANIFQGVKIEEQTNSRFAIGLKTFP